MIRRSLLALLLSATPALALELDVPGGVLTRAETSPATTVRLPAAPVEADGPVAEAEGAVRRRAYRVAGGTLTTLQLAAPLREALEASGYREVFDCRDRACGGYDFRFRLDILGEPDMHVDLGDFRYVLAERQPGVEGPETVALLVSRGRDAGYVHITEVFETSQLPAETEAEERPARAVATAPETFGEQLEARGHVVLGDLDFESGAAALTGARYESLHALAEWLGANPFARVVLVGHTDAVGSLEANVALSTRRAEAVRQSLIEVHAADPSRMTAAGIGYLAPIESNLTEAGRAANRRVEAVLLSNDE